LEIGSCNLFAWAWTMFLLILVSPSS
jgi:hypothetical protein